MPTFAANAATSTRRICRSSTPNVLDFACEIVMSGLDLPRPVNYGLVRIQPPADTPSDPRKRPFVVVDPRAGHGPGIGGFKPDSEVGAALKAGHPCYFVGFLPDPVPGQTVEDVMRAEAAFVRKVGELHPDSRGKPAVIGNCQAGWQILMAAAVWPELFGPIIVAGAPLSYWAGDMPMRYAGGLTGGSWLTALTSDLGAGRFDGAWLVQNFENLDPANTLWTKQYNLYAKVDTEGPRHLQFEKYWGGHVFLNDVEMQYIVDNLFIGNKLSTAQLVTSDGVRIDLRNIRSPIVVFCSYGDNITPPPQALGWITDLYRNDLDVVGHDQTIVYATHDSIGHLGIFVSGSVGRKEHQEFAANIDVIDVLPAGIHHMQIDEHHDDAQEGEPASDAYLTRIRRSNIDEIREIVRPDPESDRRFAAAARISEINLACYRSFVQPWVRAWSRPRAHGRWSPCIPCASATNCGPTASRWQPLCKRLRNMCASTASPSPRPILSCNCRHSFPPLSNRRWINSAIAATGSTRKPLTRCTACRWCRP
jgi:pimeloyl-ACP methyl ester carboxylesterase